VIYEFGAFRLDPANRLLTRDGKEVPLSGKAFEVLLLLVFRPGALISKEDLMASVWSGSFVEESNLTVAISTVRHALQEDPHDRRYIQTVARRGYRFIAEVRVLRQMQRAARSATLEPLAASADAMESFSSETAQPAGSAVLPQIKAGRQARTMIWIRAAAAGLLLILVGSYFFLLQPRHPIQTLAVLPFTANGPEEHDSSAASTTSDIVLIGMTDGLISRLQSGLVVRPTSSILHYTGVSTVDPVATGREQNVDAVLTGQVSSAAGVTTLKLRLIRVHDGYALWQSSFKASANDLSRLEQMAGDAAASELRSFRAAGSTSTASTELMRTNDPAYRLYLLGRYFWNGRTAGDLHKSADYFRQAINADPNYAQAYAGLADCYALMASFSVEPGQSANADARSAALSAIHLDPALADPHASLGMIYFFTDWNFSAAAHEFEQAIRLNPNYSTAHHWYALDLAAMNRPAEALYEIHLAHKLDPLSLIISTNVGWVEYLARDYSDADHDLHQALDLNPNFARARTRLGMVEMAQGNNAAAISDLSQALALSGDEDPWVEGLLGEAEARSGNRTAAERALTQLSRRSTMQYVPPISRALVLLGLGRNAEALTALQQAADDHSTSMVYARVDPSFDPIRSDPGFQALLAHNKL
jgi:DNA-binding winged helix-turn-helix (wHTH) protein/Tfp pilus assembly protein PilF/TolB-like protein